jgi:hypothetical protein
MPALQLKPTYKVVKAYYDELHNLQQLSLFTEGAVSPTFAALLRHCAGQVITVSVETVKIVNGLPDLGIERFTTLAR